MASPVGAAASLVEGGATASSVEVEAAPHLDADAYLLGFRTASGDESPYRWSFQAEQVQVNLQHERYMGDVTPIYQGTTSESAIHSNAAGVLVERLPLSYLMAVSADANNSGASYGLRLTFPIDDLQPRDSIGFSTERLAQEDDTPLRDLSDNKWRRSYEQPWDNLLGNLVGQNDPLVLEGNFTVHVFDVVFEVRDDWGRTTYDVTFGGARGDDVPSPVHDYNNTMAELRFTNATFTLLPAGRPLQANLRSIEVQAAGTVYMTDARGALQDGTGVEKALDGSLVELHANDLELEVHALSETPPEYRVQFKGFLDSAVVDGRPIDLPLPAPSGQAPPPSTVGTSPGPGWSWQAWWALASMTLLGAAATAWWLRSNRVDVDTLIQEAKLALDDRNSTRAKRLLNRVLRRDPHNETATVMTARLSLSRNRPHEALEFLQPRVNGPADLHGGVSLAYCVALRDSGDLEQARSAFAKAKRDHPALEGLEEMLLPPLNGMDSQSYT